MAYEVSQLPGVRGDAAFSISVAAVVTVEPKEPLTNPMMVRTIGSEKSLLEVESNCDIGSVLQNVKGEGAVTES